MKSKFLLIGTLLWAALLRFWQVPERFVFSYEANHMLYDINDFIAGKQSYLLGLEATGYAHHLFLPPWYLYIISPVFVFAHGEPLFFAFLHPALGLLSVYLLYKIGGLPAAFIYAVWLKNVEIDRTFMAVTLVPLATIMTVYLLKKRRYVLTGSCLGLALSLHYQMLVVIAGGLVWMWFRERKNLLMVLMPVLVSLLPIIVFDLRHHFFNLLGFFLVANTIFRGQSPYSSAHFINFAYPLIALVVAGVLNKIKPKYVLVFLIAFGLWQTKLFFNVTPGYSYPIRNKLAEQILDNLKPGGVYFADRGSFEYAYLLSLRARQRGVNPSMITMYEPWQPDNQAPLMVQNDRLIIRK